MKRFASSTGRLFPRFSNLFRFALIAMTMTSLNPASAQHPLTGTWELVRAQLVQKDGKTAVDPYYGPEARGLMLVASDGRYSLQIFRPDRAKFSSGDKALGSPEEYKAAVLGASTHAGQIVVDEASHRLVFHIDLALFPNWERSQQARDYQLTGTELTYRIPPRPDGTSAISVWRRVGS
jgi:Lipocalin-like domain